MSTPPPNPFDQSAVDDYLEQQRQKEQDQSGQPAPGQPVPGTSWTDALKSPEELTSDWIEALNSRGPDALQRGFAALAAELEDTGQFVEQDPQITQDMAYFFASLGKDLKAAADTLYTSARKRMWDLVKGRVGSYVTDGGSSFRFVPPRGSKRANYKLLEEKYPDAYAAVVTVSEPKPDAVGTLTLDPATADRERNARLRDARRGKKGKKK